MTGNNVGCWSYHIKLLQQFEDDILVLKDYFIADGDAATLIDSAIKNLPSDWDLLYAGNCDSIIINCDHLLDKENILCEAKTNKPIAYTHGYILRNYTVASKLLEKSNSEIPLNFEMANIQSVPYIPAYCGGCEIRWWSFTELLA